MMLHAPIQHDGLTYRPSTRSADVDALIQRHRDLVRKIAWHVHSGVSSCIEVEDLIQIGLVALIESARTFEERGAAFAPYAATRIRGAMIDHLRREARMSRSGIQNRRRLTAVRSTLETRLGRRADDAEMAEELGVSADDYHALVASTQPLEQESLDEVYADDQPWFADLGEGADMQLEREQLVGSVAAAIEELGEREATVLQLYFVEEMNLEEIGQILDVGAARVCQLKKAALQKLRGKLEPLA
jgi:RNA polymerase sigma factor for flagellar operon FliA